MPPLPLSLSHRPPAHALGTAALALAGFLTGPARAQDPPATAVAQPAEIERVLHAPARYAAQQRAAVRYTARSYHGPLEVDQIITRGGAVESGQLLLQLVAPDLADAITKATTRRDEALEALTAAELKDAHAAELAPVKQRGLENSALHASRNLTWWQTGGADDARTDIRLGMESSQARLDDESEELAQLERLYATANLESDTQDIVLNRARRKLTINRERHAVAARRAQQQLDVNLPQRDHEFHRTAESAQRSLDHARAKAVIDAAARARALTRVRSALNEAKKALADLEADRDALRMTAQAAGWMTRVDLQPGDRVKADTDLAVIQAPTAGHADITLAPGERDLLPEGSRCVVRVPALGGVATDGQVAHIDGHARPEGDGSRFTARVRIDTAPPGLRPGMRVVVTAPRQVVQPGPVVVPRALVYPTDDGGFRVFVAGNQPPQARHVVLGIAGTDAVQVLTGLKAGEQVVPEPSATDDDHAPVSDARADG